MKKLKQSNLSRREAAQVALLRVNTVQASKPTPLPVIDTAADEDQARADRLKAAAAKHLESARVISEVMENMSPREQALVINRAMANPKWTPEDLDVTGLAYSEELAQLRTEEGR